MSVASRIAFPFTADCYGQPLRIQYEDGALWFVHADLQAVLRMRLRMPDEPLPAIGATADGLWKRAMFAGEAVALLSERALEGLLQYAANLPAMSRFGGWLAAQLPRQVRAAVAGHREAVQAGTRMPVPTIEPARPMPVMSVEFHGRSHPVVTHEGKPYVAMKPVVEALGLDWSSQMKKIRRNQVLDEGMVMMTIPSVGGIQEGACLRLDLLNGWLFGVEVNRVRPELKERLLNYQRECYGVLWRYWEAPLAVADTLIRRDAEGRFCLNDLHKAAGDKRSDQPANFLRSDEAQRLVAALLAEIADPQNRGSEPIQTLKGGDGPQGTYVVKELVYAYAMWISPTFHLRVIRAFDALVSGTSATAPKPSLLPDADLFFALQLAFPSSTSSALLLWTLIGLDAHRQALHSSACELYRRMGGAMDRTQINRTAKKLVGEGLMEFRPGYYRVLEASLEQTLVDVLERFQPVLESLRAALPALEEIVGERPARLH